MRAAILKELKGAYQKMEIVEGYSYGKDSLFCESESEPEPEPELEPEPEPQYGAKRRTDGAEATGSNKRARKGGRKGKKGRKGRDGV